MVNIKSKIIKDSIFIDNTIKYSDNGIRYFQKLKAKLYEFHDGKLSENEFLAKVKTFEKIHEKCLIINI